jgi:hypothetical protein
VDELDKTKGPSLEDFSVMQEFEYVFNEILGFPPKRDIDFFIDLLSATVLVSNNPYRVNTL